MQNYIDLLTKTVDKGTTKKNRTGINHIGIHDEMLKFDLSKGFPVVTTKKFAFKACVAEMLGFLRGYTNAADFRALGCKVWDANSEADYWVDNPNYSGKGDLGLIYGARWRHWGNWTKVEGKATIKKVPSPTLPKPPAPQKVDVQSNKSGIVGKVFVNTHGHIFKVFREHRSGLNEPLKFDLQFTTTGTIVLGSQKSPISLGIIRDPYEVTVAGVGIFGRPYDKELSKLLRPIWQDMIWRCYGEGRDNNKYYENVSVCDRWIVFEYFVEDFKKLPRWELKLNFPTEYSLDKDFSGAMTYSPDTCRWASKVEQNVNSSQTRSFISTDTEGVEHLGRGYRAFSLEHGLSAGMVKHCVLGNCKSYKGWTFKRAADTYIYTETDQLKEVVAKLKLGIDDRRLIITGWHPSELDRQALPCCHVMMQFGIQKDKLNLMMIQRSCDMPLGVPFNITGYAWLLSVMAHITGHRVGTFTHILHDIHVYENQLSLVGEQISRKPYPLPKLWINPKIDTLSDLETWVTTDDFRLVDYRCHEAIKYTFAV